MPFDDNTLRMMRMGNIFSPTDPIQSQPAIPMQSQFPVQQPDSIYQPETRAQNRMYDLLNQFPQRNQPGIGRKILSSIVGLGGGIAGADRTLYAPYYNQLQDWQSQFGPVEKAATEERLQNVNMRQLADAMLRDKATQKRLDLQTQTEERRAKQGEESLKIKERNIALNEWKARNPNLIPKTDAEGRLIGVDPQGGSAQFILDPDGQPIHSNDLTYEQKQNLANIAGEGRAAIATQQQAGQTAREAEIRPIIDPNDPNKTILASVNPVTNRVTPLNQAGQPIRPAQTRTGTTQQPANLAAIREITQEALNAMDNVVDEKTGKLRPEVKGAVGGSFLAGYLPSTEAYSGRIKIKQLKDLMTLNLIGEMKKQSRTGATGFGNMQAKELALLENAASRIDTKQSEPDFEQAVRDARTKLMEILKDPTEDGIMRKQQRNRKTGEVRTVESTDGGKTWK